MTPDVNCYIMNMPTEIHETVTSNADGSYTIFLNARLTVEDQRKAYRHAMKHIDQNDFEKFDVQEIEAEAHKEEFEGEI